MDMFLIISKKEWTFVVVCSLKKCKAKQPQKETKQRVEKSAATGSNYLSRAVRAHCRRLRSGVELRYGSLRWTNRRLTYLTPSN